ncbi:hypothetical protein BDF21DRAFT_418459 [Thamnidium elegans]|uniref:Uncharacterized protein n=1 Tax=Thamnidium elegans TaxID=101142 RepID=A0A8H7VUD3_9FUNG|nr:hypothetical protein INT48_008856 [Thamnidium elegans]KAI8081135.1 hypothetical protein BDF21DRAFT_418459 [Thamnidium elegans]
MFRTTSNHLVKTVPAWRNASVYSSVKNYTTPVTSTPVPEKKQDQEKPVSLSARLGGSGRGKVMSAPDSADPFASFLANAKKPRGPNNNNNNERRNGNFTPRPRKQQGSRDGQFADAATATTEGGAPNNNNRPRQPRAPRVEGENNNNNNNRSRPQRKTYTEGAVAQGDNKDGQARTNNNNNRNNNNRNNFSSDGPRNNNRKMNINRSKPQEVRTRRAVTFIDKDIDWASFDTVHTTNETTVEEVKEDGELLLKDMQGDYERYVTVGSEITWSQIINGAQVSTLVGSNPTFDLSQKTAFLAAVSKATIGAAARK